MAVAAPERPLVSGVMLAALAAGEALAIAAVLRGAGELALGAHAVVVLGSALHGAALSVRGQRLGASLGAASLALALPGVGVLGLFAVVFPAWRRRRAPALGALIELEVSGPWRDEPVPRSSAVPVRSVLEIAGSVELRVQAVMALRRMAPERAVPLLRLAMADASEDVRLLAFGILERCEKALRTRLQLATAELARLESAAPRRRADLHRELAELHWELAHAGFVGGESERRVLEQAAAHARAAYELGPSAVPALLLGRIALRERRAADAEGWLGEAERRGALPVAVAPLLAESAFQARRFEAVPLALARVPEAELRRAGLGALLEFWAPGDPASAEGVA